MPGSRSAPTPTMPSLVGRSGGGKPPARTAAARPGSTQPSLPAGSNVRAGGGTAHGTVSCSLLLAAEVPGGDHAAQRRHGGVVGVAPNLGVTTRRGSTPDVSRPTRSSRRANGPSGSCSRPHRGVDVLQRTPCRSRASRTALLRYGKSRRVDDEPARSPTSTASLPQAVAKANRRLDRVVAGGRASRSPRRSSGAGLKNCDHRAARSVSTLPRGAPDDLESTIEQGRARIVIVDAVATAAARPGRAASRSAPARREQLALGRQVLDDALDHEVASARWDSWSVPRHRATIGVRGRRPPSRPSADLAVEVGPARRRRRRSAPALRPRSDDDHDSRPGRHLGQARLP